MLLKCAMYVDILEPARQLSLFTQITNQINIVKQVEKVDRTLKQYQIMQCRVHETDALATSTLPTVKHVLSVIEKGLSDVGQQSQYQGVPENKVEQSKAVVNGMIHRNVKAIYDSLASHYGSLIDGTSTESSKETKEADEVAHAVAKVLNRRVWIKDATEKSLSIQLTAISKVFNTF